MPVAEILMDSFRAKRPQATLCAFPRSGSRWLRLCFAHAAAEWLGKDSYQLYHPQPGSEHLSELRYLERNVILDAYKCPPVVTSNHQELLSHPIYRVHGLDPFLELEHHRIVYTYRDPSAALLSYFHYSRQRKNSSKSRTLKIFCKKMLSCWMEQAQLAIQLKTQQPERMLLLKYGDAYPFTSASMLDASKFLGLPFTAPQIERATALLRKQIDQLNSDPEKLHARGSNTRLEHHYEPKLLATIRAKASPLIEQMDELADG